MTKNTGINPEELFIAFVIMEFLLKLPLGDNKEGAHIAFSSENE